MSDTSEARAAWGRLRAFARGCLAARIYPDKEPPNKLDALRKDVGAVLDALSRKAEITEDQVAEGVKAWLAAPSTMELADQVKAVYRAMKEAGRA